MIATNALNEESNRELGHSCLVLGRDINITVLWEIYFESQQALGKVLSWARHESSLTYIKLSQFMQLEESVHYTFFQTA